MDVSDENNGCFVVRTVCRTWLIVFLATLATTASVSLVSGFLDNKITEPLYSSHISSVRFQQPRHHQLQQPPTFAIRFDDHSVDYYRRQADGGFVIRSSALEDRLVVLLQQCAARGSQPLTGNEFERTVEALTDLFAMLKQKDDVVLRRNEYEDDSQVADAEVEDAQMWLSNVLMRWLQLENDRRLKPVVDNLTAIIEGTVPTRQRGSPVSMNIHEQGNE
jgi:hypothetical protein